jgi:cyd operon protein YbgT
MWYFTWILGLGLALASGIISVMWLEANYAFGERDEDQTREKFETARRKKHKSPVS